MHAKIANNISMHDFVATVNDSLERDGITTDYIDNWLDTPVADALPNWAWDIINAARVASTDY